MKPIVLLFCLVIGIVYGCTAYEMKQFEKIATAENPSSRITEIIQKRGQQYARNPELLTTDLESLRQRIAEYQKIIQSIWGKKDSKQPEKKRYVKYTDKYYSRAQIDFEKGLVVVETVAPTSQEKRL
ncbi:MAG: murein transglycosylase domain-containing protein, partial [Desulfobulbaceae bacterium]|nr:murein transglycosylase domain-containing protein [Desulfobulbaceae bacterium]